MGPGQPPTPIHPELRDPRIFQIQPGRNLIQTPRAYEPITFPLLRQLCDNYDVARVAIEARKDEARGWDWDVRVKPVPGLDRSTQKERAQSFADQVARTKGFLSNPDQDNTFETWLMMLLEDLFVIDAPTLYLRPTRGSQLYAVEVVDGATIKVLVDQFGRTPRLYTTDTPAAHFHAWLQTEAQEIVCTVCDWPAAYGQIMFGTTWNYFAAYELIYEPYHQSATSPYGSPPIYWVLMAVNRALRRQAQDLMNFTEGTLPEAFYGIKDPNWTSSQLAELQELLDTKLAGDAVARSRVTLMPDGSLLRIAPDPASDVEKWLMHITTAAFGTSAYELGFEPDSGLGGAGFGDASRANAEKRGSRPLSQYLAGLFNRILAGPLGMPELEFFWRGLGQTEDQLKEAQRDEIRWKAGAYGSDEWREDMGLDPIGLGPTVFDPKLGVVLVSDLLATATATAAAENALQDTALAPNGQAPAAAEAAAVASSQPGALTTVEDTPAPDASMATMSAADDLVKWQRKALNAVKSGRDASRFTSDAIDPATSQQLVGRLRSARTAADVRAAFSEVSP